VHLADSREPASASISTGAKATGTEEASSTSRIRSAAPGWPLARDGAEVPDHGPLGVEVGGDDEEPPPLP
jgi:hypothetical protein